MSDPDKIREALLGDIAPRDEVAKALNVHERTIVRWNLPTIKVGNQNFIDLPRARQEIQQRSKRRNPRRQGPAKAAPVSVKPGTTAA